MDMNSIYVPNDTLPLRVFDGFLMENCQPTFKAEVQP